MAEKDYAAILTVEELGTEVKRILANGKPFAFDIETGYTGPDDKEISTKPFHPNFLVVGISFSDDPDWARYVPFAHDEGPNVNKTAVARLFWTLLNTGRGVPHNAMFELQGMSRFFREELSEDPFFGEAVRKAHGLYPILSDTMIEASMMQCYMPLSNGQGVGVGLKGLTYHIFGHKMTEFKSLFPEEDSELGPGTPKKKMTTIRFNTRRVCPRVVEYGCEDSAWTLALHLHHYDHVKDQLMFRTEILLLPVLCEMEIEGLVLDWAEYERQEKIITHFKEAFNEEIQHELSEKLGEIVQVNFNAPKQVANLLYERMGLPVQRDKKTGNPTTAEKAMIKLARETGNPHLLKILEWRGVSKLLSAYITKYLNELRFDPSGRARPNHNQLGAGTGRFSVDEVSYQQWPKPYHFELENGEVLDLNYRNFLIAPEDFRIIGFDFAQVEMRVLAGVVGEPAMLEAFARGVDLHKQTASVMFKVPLEEVTPKQRQAAKGLNFGILYGQGAQALAEILEISKEEAQDLLIDYFEGFSKLRAWMDAQVALGRETGSVSTPFGRQFHIWNYDDSRDIQERAMRKVIKNEKDKADKDKLLGLARYIYSEGDRLCVNAAIQGGAADYLKLGMVRAQRKIKEMGWEGKVILVMTIHDALEFYVHNSISTQEVIDALNPMVSFPVPGFPEILAEWHEGLRWGEVLEIKTDKNKKITGYEYEVVLHDKRKFEWSGTTAQEGYDWLAKLPMLIEETKPQPEPEPEKPSENTLWIEMDEFPDANEWAAAKDFLTDNSEGEDGEYPVWVKIGTAEKSLGLTLKGRLSELEELRFLLPRARIILASELDKVPF